MIRIIQSQIDYIQGYILFKYELNKINYLIEFVTTTDRADQNIKDLTKFDKFLKENALIEIHLYLNTKATNNDYLCFIGKNKNQEIIFSIYCKIYTYGIIKNEITN